MRKLSRLLGFRDRASHANATATASVKAGASTKSPRKQRAAFEKGGGKSGMRIAIAGLGKAGQLPPPMNITLQDLQLNVPAALDSGIQLASPIAPSIVTHTETPAIELDPVTLVVYEWHNVQPGVLAWVFPSLNAAVAAARTMKNAMKWAILRGQRTVKATVDVEAERARGVVLLEAV
jgi:hypothetical protein